MYRHLLSVLCLWVLFCCACAQNESELYPRKLGIIQLDEHNFYAALSKYKFVFVSYYGNNKESKTLMDEVAKLAEKLKSSESPIHVAVINIEKNEEARKKYPVHEVPSLRMFKNGNMMDYTQGYNTADDWLVWIQIVMNVPIVVNLETEFDELIQSKTVVLGCFPGNAPEAAYKNFYRVSQHFVYDPRLPQPRFAIITSASVARRHSLLSYNAMMFEDGDKAVYQGDATNLDDLLKFVDEESAPVVYKHYNVAVSKLLRYHQLRIAICNAVADCLDSSHLNQQTYKLTLDAAAIFVTSSQENEVVFIHVDTSRDNIKSSVNYYHVDENKDIPCSRMTKFDKYHSRFIPPKNALSYDAFVGFTQDVVQGKIKRNIRSESQPSDWNTYDVKTLVGSTYDDFIKDKRRTIFMMYYVPGDQGSEKALPVLNVAAKDMRSNATVVFGRMDVSKNDGEIDVHISYPSFKMFTRDGKVKPFKPKGDVTANGIKFFIESNGASSVPDPADDEAEYDFTWHDDAHPIDDVKEEEKMRERWNKEEKEMLEKAVKHEIPEEPHESHKVVHPLAHLDPEERDPKLMDPQVHADFEHHDFHHEL
ncbi:protein disulfide-isomerase-like [Ciona intestinalis]